jgi:Zn-dependent protease with chaperone function
MNKLKERIRKIIWKFYPTLDMDLLIRIGGIQFQFDEDGLFFMPDGRIAYATHQPFIPHLIIFYLQTMKNLDNLTLKKVIVHEIGHALGLNHEQISTVEGHVTK